jgi:putative sigma-54 modulation protein
VDDGDFEIRRKSFPFKPMSPEEAILQMNLLGHSFFVFIDDVTEDTCVVYSRKDGNYGLIVPEK